MRGGKYRRVYPGTGQGFLLLDGGKNNKYQRSTIQDNESPDCANVVFSNGAVETRQGVMKLNTAAIGSFAFDGLYTRRVNTGAETMVAFAGGSAWQLGGTSFTVINSAQSVFTSGIRVAAVNYENHLFIGNGGVIPYKWNGSDFTRHGVYPPPSTMTAASAATGGALASGASYTYKVTYVNSQLVEGDLGPATTHVVTANSLGNVALTSIPVGAQSYGVSARKIYRTVAGGSTFKLVTTINDNTTTTYEDAKLDAALGEEAPTDNGVPPMYSLICYHQNRLFVNDPANPNRVNYSELGEPYTFTALGFRTIGDDAADVVKTLSVYDNSVLVECEKSKWLIYMPSSDPDDWVEIRVKSAHGSKSPFALVDFQNKKLTAAMESDKFVGFSAIEGDSVLPSATLLTISSAGSELISDRIEPDVFLVQNAQNISAIVYKSKAYIALAYGPGQTTNNRIYLMDFSISNLSKQQKEAWVPWTGLNAAQFTIYDGNLYYGSSTATGFVYQLESGVYNDDGAAINSYFWTKEFSGFKEDVNSHKDFRYANLLVEKTGNYYMNVSHRVDSDTGDGTSQQVDLNPGGSLWGVMVWGVDLWGGGVAQENIQLDLGTASGKRIQFKFTNQNVADQRFKVHYMNFSYNVKGVR